MNWELQEFCTAEATAKMYQLSYFLESNMKVLRWCKQNWAINTHTTFRIEVWVTFISFLEFFYCQFFNVKNTLNVEGAIKKINFSYSVA
jgi:hypothetical protein